MKRLSVIFTLLFITSAMANDVIVLKNGKEIKGKITSQDKDSVSIDNGTGIKITYYQDEITSINSQTKSESPAKPAIALHPMNKETFATQIIRLKDQNFKAIDCRINADYFKKLDNMLSAVTQATGGLYVTRIEWDAYHIKFDHMGKVTFEGPKAIFDFSEQVKSKMKEVDAAMQRASPDQIEALSKEKDANYQQLQQMNSDFNTKIKNNLGDLEKAITDLMGLLSGKDDRFKITNPIKQDNGDVSDAVDMNLTDMINKATNNPSPMPSEQGMRMSIKVNYIGAALDKFIMNHVGMTMKIGSAVDVNMKYDLTYQQLTGVYFPEKLKINVVQKDDQGNENKSTMNVTFDQCQLQ